MVIFKYPLHLMDTQSVFCYKGFEPLTVQLQDNVITLWGWVNTNNTQANRTVHILGTGREHHFNLDSVDYVGTVQLHGMVWHVFVEHKHEPA